MLDDEYIVALKNDILKDKEAFNKLYKNLCDLEKKTVVKKFLDSNYESIINDNDKNKILKKFYIKLYNDTRSNLNSVTISLLKKIKLLLSFSYPGYISYDNILWDKGNNINELDTATITFPCGKIGTITKTRLIDNEVILMVKELKPLGFSLNDVGLIYNYQSDISKTKVFNN